MHIVILYVPDLDLHMNVISFPKGVAEGCEMTQVLSSPRKVRMIMVHIMGH